MGTQRERGPRPGQFYRQLNGQFDGNIHTGCELDSGRLERDGVFRKIKSGFVWKSQAGRWVGVGNGATSLSHWCITSCSEEPHGGQDQSAGTAFHFEGGLARLEGVWTLAGGSWNWYVAPSIIYFFTRVAPYPTPSSRAPPHPGVEMSSLSAANQGPITYQNKIIETRPAARRGRAGAHPRRRSCDHWIGMIHSESPTSMLHRRFEVLRCMIGSPEPILFQHGPSPAWKLTAHQPTRF